MYTCTGVPRATCICQPRVRARVRTRVSHAYARMHMCLIHIYWVVIMIKFCVRIRVRLYIYIYFFFFFLKIVFTIILREAKKKKIRIRVHVNVDHSELIMNRIRNNRVPIYIFSCSDTGSFVNMTTLTYTLYIDIRRSIILTRATRNSKVHVHDESSRVSPLSLYICCEPENSSRTDN